MDKAAKTSAVVSLFRVFMIPMLLFCSVLLFSILIGENRPEMPSGHSVSDGQDRGSTSSLSWSVVETSWRGNLMIVRRPSIVCSGPWLYQVESCCLLAIYRDCANAEVKSVVGCFWTPVETAAGNGVK
jgi:hypothetical protein